MQYNKTSSEKCLLHRSHFTVNYEKDVENRRVFSLVLNVRKDFEDVPLKNRYFVVVVVGQSSVKTVADRHGYAVYHYKP